MRNASTKELGNANNEDIMAKRTTCPSPRWSVPQRSAGRNSNATRDFAAELRDAGRQRICPLTCISPVLYRGVMKDCHGMQAAARLPTRPMALAEKDDALRQRRRPGSRGSWGVC